MAAIPNSILDTTKKALGIEADYHDFDIDILLHINSVFSTLQQLGIGPDDGFMVDDSNDLWTDFLGDKKYLNNVKTYMILRVRNLFDPPATSFAIDSFKEQIKELEWRLELYSPRDYTVTVPTTPGPVAGKPSIWDLTGLEDFPAEAPVNAVGVDFITGNIFRKS